MIQPVLLARRLTAGRDLPRLAREALLWFGAMAGLLCLVLAGLAMAFHITPVVFRSGSMAPAIDTGALALTKTVNAPDLKVGDVVTVTTAKGSRVTHRITSISPNGAQVTLVLKGDANEIVDTEAYTVSSADRVIYSVPKLGYFVSALSGRAGAFGGGLLIGLVVITAFGRKPRQGFSGLVPVRGFLRPPIMEEPAEPRRRAKVVGKRRSYVVAASLGVLALALIAGIRGTNAYFLDSAVVDSGTFTMKATPTPVSPVITTCSPGNGNNGNTINWTYGTNPTTFEVRYTASAHPAQSVAGTARTVILTSGLNNESGSFYLVAIVGGVASAPSNLVNYSGNGSSKVCTVVP